MTSSREANRLDVAIGGAALFQVALMIFLGGPERAGGRNFGGDGVAELSAGFQRLFGFFRGGFLLGRMVKDGGAILLAEIRALAIDLVGS